MTIESTNQALVSSQINPRRCCWWERYLTSNTLIFVYNEYTNEPLCHCCLSNSTAYRLHTNNDHRLCHRYFLTLGFDSLIEYPVAKKHVTIRSCKVRYVG